MGLIQLVTVTPCGECPLKAARSVELSKPGRSLKMCTEYTVMAMIHDKVGDSAFTIPQSALMGSRYRHGLN